VGFVVLRQAVERGLVAGGLRELLLHLGGADQKQAVIDGAEHLLRRTDETGHVALDLGGNQLVIVGDDVDGGALLPEMRRQDLQVA